MTEAEWLACTDPEKMLEYLRGKVSERKLRLFACACCRRVWQLLPEVCSRHAVEVAERYADGAAAEEEREQARLEVLTAWQGDEERCLNSSDQDVIAEAARSEVFQASSRTLDSRDAGWAAAGAAAWADAGYQAVRDDASADAGAKDVAWATAREIERAAQCPVLRDLLGNPFRAVALDPAWRTPDVLALAHVAYDERILPAGTLEDAGCPDADLLGHLRSPGPHVRGCWALDLLLGTL